MRGVASRVAPESKSGGMTGCSMADSGNSSERLRMEMLELSGVLALALAEGVIVRDNIFSEIQRYDWHRSGLRGRRRVWTS